MSIYYYKVYLFLSESTYKKERKTIVTDLKHEYSNPIWKLCFKHQFCIFHSEQKISRDINNYISRNKLSDVEKMKLINIRSYFIHCWK